MRNFLFCYCFECFVKVLNNIIDIFCTNRKTDCIWFDTLVKKFFFCALAVCCCSRVDNQRFNICYVCKQREQFQVINEVFCFLCITLDLKCEDRTAAVREVFLIKFLLACICRYRRMMNFFYLWMIVQVLNNFQCIFHMTLYTKRQCFKSLKEDEGAYRRNGSTCVTKKDCTDLCNKCSRSACFCKAYTMVAWVWLCQGCKFA